ncbi:RNA polymerase sigma-70 factor (ECF subfamily) [Pseudobacter ginsenosidimutans]|uniref:RNA polymerase sigma-70 factor (ECF subfamily) n=2 Tax=Pseudobacter ginsenosidimutans TaxID=661488 RepID=A0A4Q7MB78_9BACT|nr:RNA polymerase sigma-70 factor (ECF subfamily) [Pseudobacter ginsenosidimutans]
MGEAVIFGARFQNLRMAVSEAGSTHLLGTAFENVFKSHFKSLHSYAYTIVKDDMVAEEMVQNVFCKIWEKKGHLEIETSLTAYLYRAVYNESLNHIKHQKVRLAYQAHASYQMKEQTDSASKKVLLSDLEQKLRKAMSELPEQCRTIFQMSRFEELKYQEIADRLGISIKTVENQMGKALKLLRSKLIDFLPLLLIILTNL